MIAIVRQKMWFLGYPVTSSIFAPFWYVNFKLRICMLKIKTSESLSAVSFIFKYYKIL